MVVWLNVVVEPLVFRSAFSGAVKEDGDVLQWCTENHLEVFHVLHNDASGVNAWVTERYAWISLRCLLGGANHLGYVQHLCCL